MRIFLAAIVAVLLTGLMSGPAFAWEGGKITDVSCPEVHVFLPKANGKWLVKRTVGEVVKTNEVDTSAGDMNLVLGNTYAPGPGLYPVTVEIGNAADFSDGYKKYTATFLDCAAPASTPGATGPPGPKGTRGPRGRHGRKGISRQWVKHTIRVMCKSDNPIVPRFPG